MALLWVTALAGVAGSAFTLLAQWLWRTYRAPVLAITFLDDKGLGCRVPTPAVVKESQEGIRQVYLRLKIENQGRTFAKNVSVSVRSIEYAAEVKAPENIFAEEVLRQPVALTGELVFNLAAGGHQFVDLVHTEESANGLRLVFDFHKGPMRLTERGFGRGDYWYTLFVAAENATSLTERVSWKWDGTLEGLNVRER